jgi:glycosyltransferase involved in cell wall biosynthesis
MLFLSRIHPKKGLPMLIDAWETVRPEGWRLVIAGPSERGHRAEIEAKIEASGLSENLEVIGPVENHEKWEIYRKSDVFVLPTHSENFGVVVAEALASGIPAITTTGAPWEILEKHDCGWWVEPTVGALTEAISDSVQRTDEERLAMGKRGRQLVTQKYSWSSVSSRLQRAYHWVLEGGTRPSCVRLYSE